MHSKGQKHSMLNKFFKLLPLQGVTNERALTQGVASLALGYVLLPLQGVGVHCRRLIDSKNSIKPCRKILCVFPTTCLSYENGYSPRPNLTHNRVTRLVIA